MTDYETLPPFFLKSKLPQELRRIQVVRYVTVGAVNEKRVEYLPQVIAEDDAELACQAYFDFLDACTPEKLSCGTGQLKFAFFPKILQGAAAAKWRSAMEEDAGPHNSNAAFLRVARLWIAKYVDSTACNDMKEYLLQAKKVYTMTVTQTAERLKVLAKYMSLLPGAPNDGADDVYDDTDMKTALHRLMLPAWRTALMKARCGRSFLNDDDYTFANMVEFYKVMESEERGRRARESGSNRAGRGGRGSGRSPRGGRGSGRFSGRGGRYTADRQVSRRRSYEGEDYGPPAQRARFVDGYNGGYTAGGYQGNRPPFGRGSPPGRGRSYSGGRGRGRFPGRGRSSGRGRSESHAIAAPPMEEPTDPVEETPQEEEEHYHQEEYEPRRQEHWVDEHFGYYDVAYGYDEDYHVQGDGYDY